MSDKVAEAPATAEPPKVEAVPKAEEPAVAPVPAAEETKAEPAKPVVPKAEDAPKAEEGSKAEQPAPTAKPIQELWATAKANGHPEIWGVTLADPETHVPSQIIFQKYLNANDGDLTKAKDQLTKTLEWRAETKPLDLLKKEYSKAKFEGLGYVTSYGGAATADPEEKEVFTWNIYGGVKSMDETFGNLEDFIHWRVALMELALQDLSLATATKPITADYDPYKIFQVHDYKSISFFRQHASVKAASTETIRVFAQNYPELLKEKFFVNVPAIMGFMYAFFKLFVAAKTVKKFHPMSNGGNLAKEFGASKVKTLGELLPAEYGGKGGELKAQGKETALV